MGNSFRYLCAKNYQYRTWFDRIIEKIRRVQFFCLTGYNTSLFTKEIVVHNVTLNSLSKIYTYWYDFRCQQVSLVWDDSSTTVSIPYIKCHKRETTEIQFNKLQLFFCFFLFKVSFSLTFIARQHALYSIQSTILFYYFRPSVRPSVRPSACP